MDKKLLFRKLLAASTEMLESARTGANNAQTEANSHVGAMESRYDTFKEEAQYLAAGFKRQMAELSEAQAQVTLILNDDKLLNSASKTVALATAVLLEDEETHEENTFIIAPALGGTKIELNGEIITVLTPQSPMGRALIGKTVDDDVTAVIGSKTRNYNIRALG